MKQPKIRDLTHCALAAAILCVTAQISVPVGDAPITIQPFALALVGGVLGWKWGTLAAIVYVALGALGLPVFANFRGGAAMLAGATGGYLWTYPLLALGAGLGKTRLARVLFSLAGLGVLEVVGAFQLAHYTGAPIGPYIAMFVPKDMIVVLLAILPAEKMRRMLKWAKC